MPDVVSVLIPRLVMPVFQKDWDGQEATIALYATVRAKQMGGPSQRLMRQRVQDLEIQPDPEGCDWGYGIPFSGTVRVRIYTFFGIPESTWVLTCGSGYQVWGFGP